MFLRIWWRTALCIILPVYINILFATHPKEILTLRTHGQQVYTKFLRDFGKFSNASPSSPFFESVLKHLKTRVSFLNCETIIIDYKMANTILFYNLLLFFIVVRKARCILKSALLRQNYNVVVLYKSDCFLSLSFFLYYQIY